ERATAGFVDKLAMRQGLKFVRGNPGLTVQRSVIKFFDFWGLERELVAGAAHGDFGHVAKPVVILLALAIFGSYARARCLGFSGLSVTPPADRRVHWFLLLLIAFICGMHTIVFGYSRYHLPLMPLVLLYAAAAVVHGRAIWQQRRSWRFWLAGGSCLVLTLG